MRFLPAVETGTLISIIIIAGGVLLFSELVEMVEGEPHAFDRWVLLALRNPGIFRTRLVQPGSNS